MKPSPQTPKSEEKKQLREEVINLHNVYLGIFFVYMKYVELLNRIGEVMDKNKEKEQQINVMKSYVENLLPKT